MNLKATLTILVYFTILSETATMNSTSDFLSISTVMATFNNTSELVSTTSQITEVNVTVDLLTINKTQNESLYDDYSLKEYPIQKIFGYFNVFIAVAGCLGNSLIIIVPTYSKRAITSTMIYLIG